jgi:sRNA-binding carbon storage regulator CsrA
MSGLILRINAETQVLIGENGEVVAEILEIRKNWVRMRFIAGKDVRISRRKISCDQKPQSKLVGKEPNDK